MNSFLSKIGYSAIYVYVEFFIGLVASIFIARTLGPEQYGLYSYFIKLAAILLIFVNGGISTGVLRFLAEYTYNADEKKIVTFNVYRFFSRVQFAKCVIVLLFVFLVLHETLGIIIESEHEVLLFLFLAGVAFKSYYMFRVGALKGLERFDRLAWIVLAVCPLYLLLVLIGASRQEDIQYFSAIYLLTSMMFWLVSYLLIKPFLKKGAADLGNDFKARANSYIRIVTVNTVLAALVLGYVEIFFLKMFQSTQDIGYFNIGLTMAGAAVNLVPGIYNSILMPAIVKNAVDNNGQQTENARLFVFGTIRHMLALTLFVVVPAAFYSHNLIMLFYGEAYEAAAFPLQMMLYGAIATAFNYPAIAYFVSKDRQGDMLKINVAVLALSVCWGYFLIQNFGLQGAVISNLMTTFATASCLFVLLLKDFKKMPHLSLFVKTGLTAVIAIGGVSLIEFDGSLLVEMFAGSLLYVVLFLLLARFLNIFTEDELRSIGKMFAKLKRN